MDIREWSLRNSLLASAMALTVGFVPTAFAEDEVAPEDPIVVEPTSEGEVTTMEGEVVDPIPDGTDECGVACYSVGGDGADPEMVPGDDVDPEMLPLITGAPALEDVNTGVDSIDVSGAAGIADYLEATALESPLDSEVTAADTSIVVKETVDVAQAQGKTSSISGGHLK
jgi:hypothetical protein